MNTRRRMRYKYFVKMISTKYFDKHSVRYILKYNKLLTEFAYTKYSNKCMRKTKHFGLPNRKEFEKQMEE